MTHDPDTEEHPINLILDYIVAGLTSFTGYPVVEGIDIDFWDIELPAIRIYDAGEVGNVDGGPRSYDGGHRGPPGEWRRWLEVWVDIIISGKNISHRTANNLALPVEKWFSRDPHLGTLAECVDFFQKGWQEDTQGAKSITLLRYMMRTTFLTNYRLDPEAPPAETFETEGCVISDIRAVLDA